MNRKKKFEWYGVIRVTAAILIALLIAAAIIFAVADDPGTALYRFLLGPFSTKRNFFNVIETMIPLVFCGLAINVMHKSGLFSMVADSSFYFAGVMAATLAIACPMPNILHQIVILAVAMAVGGVIGIIPVLIKRKTGANELVISLMMNYIFFNFGYWLIRKFFLDTSNGSFSIGFQPTATLGKMLKGTNTHYSDQPAGRHKAAYDSGFCLFHFLYPNRRPCNVQRRGCGLRDCIHHPGHHDHADCLRTVPV